jgi:WD40 repeat protein
VTDVYALGSILYEMLTGRPPFDAEGPAETINQLLNEEPLSPLFIRPALPRDAVTICLKCLEKSPRKRYATALELAEDLHRFQAGEPIHARPVGLAEQAYRWCRRRPTVAGLVGLSSVLALICVVAGIGYLIQRNAAVGYLSQLNAELEKQVEDEKQQIDNENHEIARLHVRIGLGAMEEGNTFTAVLHFMHALDMDEGTDRDQNHLTRIGTALRQCPRLLDVTWFEQEVLCADHQQAAMIGANHVIDVRRLRETQSAGSGLKHTEPPYEGALSPDGRFLGVLAGKGKATIWNLATKEAHDLSSENREGVRRLVFHPNGRIVFAQRMEAIVEAWELAAWKPIAWEGMTKTTVLSALSDDGRWLLTCDAEHSGQVWDAGTGEPIGAVLRFENPVRSARIAPGGAILAVLGSNNELSIWNVRANRRLGNSIRLPCAVSRIVFSPDGARVATIGNDRVLRVWQIQTGVMAAQTLPLEHGTTIENFSADGRCLLTLSESGGARVWDSATGRAATPPLRHGGRLVFAAFQADGTELVTVSRSGLKCVWELPRGPEVRRSAPSELTSGTGSSVNRRLIELANGITVRTNGGTDGLLAPARRGEQVLEHALLSPDGRRVAFCDDTTTVFIRDSAGVESSTPQLRHRSPVRHAAFSPDGKRMLTACEDGTVLLWDVGSGELLAHPMRHTLPIQRVMFRDEDTRAHIFHEGDSVSMWDLRADPRPREELRTLAQILSGTEIDGSQREQALDPRSLRERWNRLSSAR